VKNLAGRLAVTAVAGIGAGIVAAIVLTVADLYLAGHGYGSTMRESITWAPAGVHMSIGDVVMLGTVAGVAGTTWYLSGLVGRG
jgi:hypothetical protein